MILFKKINNAYKSAQIPGKDVFEEIKHKSSFISLNNLLPKENSYLFMMVSVFSPLFISLSVFDVLYNLAFEHNVFWETDEKKWLIHQNKAHDTSSSWPVDHMVYAVDHPQGRHLDPLIRAFSGAMVHRSPFPQRWLYVTANTSWFHCWKCTHCTF